MYILISVDVTINMRQRMSLKAMQKFVGGYVEQHRNFLINEDGLRLKLPQNKSYPEFVGNIILREEER